MLLRVKEGHHRNLRDIYFGAETDQDAQKPSGKGLNSKVIKFDDDILL